MADILGPDNKQYVSIQDSSTYERGEGGIDNPSGALDSESFLKLFIESLKNQSINSTTDIKEIMQYTASMTTVQTNNSNKKALESVVDTLSKNSDYKSRFSILPSIGKLAITNLNTLKFDGKLTSNFSMFADKPMSEGIMQIKNQAGNIVREISLDKYVNAAGLVGKDDSGTKLEGAKGLLTFSWDGTLPNGSTAEKGDYGVQIKYKNEKGISEQVNLGEYKVQSVKFKDGEAYLNVGTFDVSLKDVVELREASL